MSPAAHALKYPIQVFVFPLENAINVKEALKHKRHTRMHYVFFEQMWA